MKEADVLIVGAGAAGLMCAREAAGRGRRVIVLDHAKQAGTKILLSGGGYCNFTNRDCRAEHYRTGNPHFCKSALARFGSRDAISLAEGYGLAWEERELGRLFLLSPAKSLVKALAEDCTRRGAEFVLDCAVESVEKQETFILHTSRGDFRGGSLVIATGGLSYPQAGASAWGHRIARQFGLRVTACEPALVGLRYGPEDRKWMGDLTGIALEAEVSCGSKRFCENVLFTHEGLSGPAILQASVHWQGGEEIQVNWLPGRNVRELLEKQKREKGSGDVKGWLGLYIPRRMAQVWAERYCSDTPLAQLTREELARAAESIQNWRFVPAGTEGYRKAEATRGGVDTAELSSKTMEAKSAPGLYCIGEVMDVTGELGGYNLQWAWSSGWAAGQNCG